VIEFVFLILVYGDRKMIVLKSNIKRNNLEIVLFVSVFLIILGFSLSIIPFAITNEFERLLGSSGLTIGEIWGYDSDFQ
jgi:hypothetical protein